VSKIRIYGASDDLIEVEGPINDEYNSYETRYMWRGDLIAPGGAVRIKLGQETATTERTASRPS
jgi:hypothetical protein